MKDFMTLLREAEVGVMSVGVMSIWFLCTVCRKVLRGRTTCRQEQGSPLGRQDRVQGKDRSLLTLLAGQGGEGVLFLGGCSSSSSSRGCSSSSSLTACL
jgi:hypothetical protein